MKNEDRNICIRIDRDEDQIERGKSLLVEHGSILKENSSLFSLLGNEVRIKIIFLLLEEKRLCVCDLAEILRMKIPAISQHLRKLKDVSIVETKREGTVVFYSIKYEMKDKVTHILTHNEVV